MNADRAFKTMSHDRRFMTRNSLIGIGTQLLLLLGLCSAQEILNTYPLLWGSVPTATFNKNLSANCICNLIAFSCDPGCCCDPYCPPAVTAAIIANGTCLPQGPPAQTLDYCIQSSYVQQVGSEHGMK